MCLWWHALQLNALILIITLSGLMGPMYPAMAIDQLRSIIVGHVTSHLISIPDFEKI